MLHKTVRGVFTPNLKDKKKTPHIFIKQSDIIIHRPSYSSIASKLTAFHVTKHTQKCPSQNVTLFLLIKTLKTTKCYCTSPRRIQNAIFKIQNKNMATKNNVNFRGSKPQILFYGPDIKGNKEVFSGTERSSHQEQMSVLSFNKVGPGRGK